jgi:hypothetical protein
MEARADNGAGIGGHDGDGDGGGRLQGAPSRRWHRECTLKAVQKAAKLVVVRLRASTYPFKRNKKHTLHTRRWSPRHQAYMRTFASVGQMNPGRIRRHMRRGRKSLFLSKPLTWAACYSFPDSEHVFWGAPALALEHHPITYFPIPSVQSPSYPFCAVRSSRVRERLTLHELCSQLEARVLPKARNMGWYCVAKTLGERIADLESVLGAVDGTPSVKLIALEGKAKKPVSYKAHSWYARTRRH